MSLTTPESVWELQQALHAKANGVTEDLAVNLLLRKSFEVSNHNSANS